MSTTTERLQIRHWQERLNFQETMRFSDTFMRAAIRSTDLRQGTSELDAKSFTEKTAEARRQQKRLDDSFMNAQNRGIAPPELLALAHRVADFANSRCPGVIQPPFLTVATEGNVILFWDNNIEHLEVEITKEQVLEFFAMNHKTGETWAEDIEVPNEKVFIPETFMQKMLQFRIVR